VNNIIEYDIPKETFIGGYIIPSNITDNMLNYFETNKERAAPGVSATATISGGGVVKVDNDIKESLDYTVSFEADHWPIYDYRVCLQKCIEKYIERYPEVDTLPHFNILEHYNIQYYPIGGGFKKWHFERSSLEQSNRILVFMTYLNDVEDGGTEFKYQNFKSPAKKGLTLIWPTDWTHTHRGIISKTKEKYIVTGWCNFRGNR
tara:strand:+ start:94 stop:705 length:612 start_codon:yes stop_codon:yes gene_type:complete